MNKVIPIVLILLLGAGVLIALSVIPSNAVGGPATYTCTLQITGTYNDLGVIHDVQPFMVNFGSCNRDSMLDLFPNLQFNLLGFTLKFGVSLVDGNGGEHCSGCTLGVSIPALETSYAFSSSAKISNIPVGSYILTVSSPYSLGSYAGPNEYSLEVQVP